jgi:hypothetical protein
LAAKGGFVAPNALELMAYFAKPVLRAPGCDQMRLLPRGWGLLSYIQAYEQQIWSYGFSADQASNLPDIK